VEHNHKHWLKKYKQGHMHGLDKWMTPQERNGFKNKNNNNFKGKKKKLF
jgi:hypothetical protein